METVGTKAPKLIDRMRQIMRVKHYSLRTEKSYVHWVRRYIFYHNKRHPQEMGAGEVQSFLSYLAVNQRVSASTQNQALNALVFLYKHVLKKELGAIDAVRAWRPKRLPVVLAREEAQRVLSLLSGKKILVCLRIAVFRSVTQNPECELRVCLEQNRPTSLKSTPSWLGDSNVNRR